jgi:hypothetical protein
MSGFKITYAPPVVESLKTKTKRDITASQSDSTITSANVLEGAYYRTVESGAKAKDILVITNVDTFASECGLEIGDSISFKIYVENAGTWGLVLPSPRNLAGISYFGDVPPTTDTSIQVDLEFFYPKIGKLVVSITNKSELKI